MIGFIPAARQLVGRAAVLDVCGRAFVALHEHAAHLAGKPRWGDKVPENVLHWRDWQQLLGDRWLMVHVVRNPLDTIASLREAQFAELPTDLMGQILLYREYLEQARQFSDQHRDRYLEVVYEELVTHPERTVAALMNGLAEQFQAVQLRFNDQPHELGLEDPKVAATSTVHADSVGRWPELLSVHEAELIWDLTHDLWAQIDPALAYVNAP